jgi:hypothetical protein
MKDNIIQSIFQAFSDVDLTGMRILGWRKKTSEEQIKTPSVFHKQTGYMLTGDYNERCFKKANLEFGKGNICDMCGKELLPYNDKYLCPNCEKQLQETIHSNKETNAKLAKVWFVNQQ